MTKSIFIFFLSLSILFSCSSADDQEQMVNDPSTSINKIMPLGASRVEGNRPNYESYRYELWKDLIDGGWTFDFVGTQDDLASYSQYNGFSFDIDHEGRGGWTSGQILGGISGWLNQAGAPDIVLFSSPGGNDALQGLSYNTAISNINAIIDVIQEANPNVTIIMEQLAPAHSTAMTPDLTNFLTQMQQDVITIANAQTTATSQVMVVDMYTNFSDTFLADDVHYNEMGASFIADRYYNVLANVLQQ